MTPDALAEALTDLHDAATRWQASNDRCWVSTCGDDLAEMLGSLERALLAAQITTSAPPPWKPTPDCLEDGSHDDH